MLLHAVGQGAIGIECREDDTRVLELLQTLDHYPTRVRVTAERSFMKVLEGGCSVPLGIHSEWTKTVEDDNESLLLKGSVTSLDGSIQLEDTVATSFSASLPRAEKVVLAELLGKDLAELMVSHGARDILLAIRAEQQAQMPGAFDATVGNAAS